MRDISPSRMGTHFNERIKPMQTKSGEHDAEAFEISETWPLYKQGSSGENVCTIQDLLRYCDYTLVADGQFGPITTSTVKSFRGNGLEVDGIVGPQTWEKLIVTVSSGSSGEAVIALQRQLNAHGASLVVDGKFGPATNSAVKSFQSENGLNEDGVGPNTWNKLMSTGQQPSKKLPDINGFGPKIENYASYVAQAKCDPHDEPGVVAFRDLIMKVYPRTGDFGISVPCKTGEDERAF